MPAATKLGGRRSRARARLACWRAAHEPPDLVRAAPPSPSCRIRREGRRDAERRAATPLCSRVLVTAQLMLRAPHLSLSFSSDLRAAPSRSSRATVSLDLAAAATALAWQSSGLGAAFRTPCSHWRALDAEARCCRGCLLLRRARRRLCCSPSGRSLALSSC